MDLKKRYAEFQQYVSHDLETGDGDSGSTVLNTMLDIGIVVWRFNALERSLDRAICESINDRTDAVGMIVIHGMQFAQKVELYRRLCEDLHASVAGPVPSFTGLVDRLKGVAKVRNLVVHADWSNSDAEGYTYTRMQIKQGDMQQEYVQLTSESMERVAEEIGAASNQLDAYYLERAELLRDKAPAAVAREAQP